MNNKINKKIKHSFNNTKEKSEEKSKKNIIENISNTISNTINNINTLDTYSREINDTSNSKIFYKNKNNMSFNQKVKNSKRKSNRTLKRIKMENSKPLKLKNLMLFKDLKKPYTFRKNQKFLDEYIFQ